jgi:tetratricopeptide (TPR) repeat protein
MPKQQVGVPVGVQSARRFTARRYEESVATWAEVLSLDPDFKANYTWLGFAHFGLGDFQSARASCETKPDYWSNQWCLAVIYEKLGRHTDAEAELAKLKAATGDASAYQYATIYAQWGNRAKALEWLETALRLRDPGLEFIKTDVLLDPIRQESRFQAIQRELKFPS